MSAGAQERFQAIDGNGCRRRPAQDVGHELDVPCPFLVGAELVDAVCKLDEVLEAGGICQTFVSDVGIEMGRLTLLRHR
jgi:hypothetical protein